MLTRFLDPDYNPNPAQNLTNLSRPPQLPTYEILSKSVHNLLRYSAKIKKSGVNPAPQHLSLIRIILRIQERLLDHEYDKDQAPMLTSSSMSRHLSTRKISSKSIQPFLSNLANSQTDRQTDRQTRSNAFTSSFVGGKQRTPIKWIRPVQLCYDNSDM